MKKRGCGRQPSPGTVQTGGMPVLEMAYARSPRPKAQSDGQTGVRANDMRKDNSSWVGMESVGVGKYSNRRLSKEREWEANNKMFVSNVEAAEGESSGEAKVDEGRGWVAGRNIVPEMEDEAVSGEIAEESVVVVVEMAPEVTSSAGKD